MRARSAHGPLDAARVLLRRQRREASSPRQLDVDRQPVGVEPGLRDQLRRGLGDRASGGCSRGSRGPRAALRATSHQLLHRVVARCG